MSTFLKRPSLGVPISFLIVFTMCGLIGMRRIRANPPPEKMVAYDKAINALFEHARFCSVDGMLAIRYSGKKVSLTLVGKDRIDKLRATLLSMEPEYAGTLDPNDKSVSLYGLYLGFELLDANKQSIGTFNFVEGRFLILNHKHIFVDQDKKLFGAVGRLFLTKEELTKK